MIRAEIFLQGSGTAAKASQMEAITSFIGNLEQVWAIQLKDSGQTSYVLRNYYCDYGLF